MWKDNSLSITIKVRFVRSVMFSIFRYEAETWAIRDAERKKIDSFDRTNASVLAGFDILERLIIATNVPGKK